MEMMSFITASHIISISKMPKAHILILITFALVLGTTRGQCTVCNRCIDCAADVYSDSYIDAIDRVLHNKIEQLGYIVHVLRQETPQFIRYDMIYSGGLLIQLALQLPSLEIQLIDYQITGGSTQQITTQTEQNR